MNKEKNINREKGGETVFYVLLVSHGDFAPGLHSALRMIAGDRDNVLSTSLRDVMGADEYAARVESLLGGIRPEDRIVVLADILGGSPLTTAMKVLADHGLLAHTRAFGGMSLPMALTLVLTGENLADTVLADTLITETCGAVKELELDTSAEAEDDI